MLRQRNEIYSGEQLQWIGGNGDKSVCRDGLKGRESTKNIIYNRRVIRIRNTVTFVLSYSFSYRIIDSSEVLYRISDPYDNNINSIISLRTHENYARVMRYEGRIAIIFIYYTCTTTTKNVHRRLIARIRRSVLTFTSSVKFP